LEDLQQKSRPLLASVACLSLLVCSGAPLSKVSFSPASLQPSAESNRSLLANVRESGPYELTPQRRALLNTIRYAEGTWKDGEDQGYQIMYGGGKFKDLSRHPETVVKKRYSSAAAGAYQFLPTTWKGVAKELKLNSFEPKHQDQAALHLVKRRGALQEIDRSGLTPKAMEQLAPEWASFPTRAGRSAYGQPVKSHQELARFYSSNLRDLKRHLGA
jgi:muramidase (phage lysozyme)